MHAARTRLLIVGQAHGPGLENMPPWTHTYSGRRLAKLLDVDPARLSDLVDTETILERCLPEHGLVRVTPAAIAGARRILDRHDNRRIVACGPTVAGALMGIDEANARRLVRLRWHETHLVDRSMRALAVMPHPSGANRWWNDAANYTSAQRFLREELIP